MKKSSSGTVFSRRLREFRTVRDMSQRALGVAMGLDPFVASTRINRYEQAVSWPNLSVIQRIADTLKIPAALLIADDDDLAELLWCYGNATKRERKAMLQGVRNSAGTR